MFISKIKIRKITVTYIKTTLPAKPKPIAIRNRAEGGWQTLHIPSIVAVVA